MARSTGPAPFVRIRGLLSTRGRVAPTTRPTSPAPCHRSDAESETNTEVKIPSEGGAHASSWFDRFHRAVLVHCANCGCAAERVHRAVWTGSAEVRRTHRVEPRRHA